MNGSPEDFPRAGRAAHPADTVLRIGGAVLGGGGLCWIAGPCAVESQEQILSTARAAKAAGAAMLRGGVFKPRTSPYTFQGLGAEGFALLLAAKEATGLPIVTEITDAAQLPLLQQADMLQVGARNMYNYELLHALGRQDKPVLLKRGLSATIAEWLMSAEHILAAGNPQVALCERGIRTFETATRNTLDLAAVALVKRLSHLPVVVDPSHGTGDAALIPPMALAAVAAGADAVMLEVHPDPAVARSDGPQSLTPGAFEAVVRAGGRVRAACGYVPQK